MAGPGDRGQGGPQPTSHPRMTAGLPGGGSSPGQGPMASGVAEAAGQVREKVQEYASGLAGRVEDAWESARQGVRRGASAVADTAEDFWTSTQNLIRRYPVAAVAVAFGVGCLTTMCLSATMGHAEDDMTRRMSRYSA